MNLTVTSTLSRENTKRKRKKQTNPKQKTKNKQKKTQPPKNQGEKPERELYTKFSPPFGGLSIQSADKLKVAYRLTNTGQFF